MGKCQFKTSAWWEGLHGIGKDTRNSGTTTSGDNENLCSAFSWWRPTHSEKTLYKVLVIHGLKTKHEH